MKRVWKPLDVKGLRLYEVVQRFVRHPEWNRRYVVAATSPSDAARLMTELSKDALFMEEPVHDGRALNVYMPSDWWENGTGGERPAQVRCSFCGDYIARKSAQFRDSERHQGLVFCCYSCMDEAKAVYEEGTGDTKGDEPGVTSA